MNCPQCNSDLTVVLGIKPKDGTERESWSFHCLECRYRISGQRDKNKLLFKKEASDA